MKLKGTGGIYTRGNVLWIHYSLRGKVFRESTDTNDPVKARRFLKHRLDQVGTARQGAKQFIGPQQEKVTINEILDDQIEHYRQGGKRGIRREVSPQMQSHLKRLRSFFGDRLAMGISTRDIDEFKSKLKAEWKTNATIDRALQLLRAAYRHAVRVDPPKLIRALHIELLDESHNVRKGKFTPQQAELLASILPEYLSDYCRFADLIGERSGELKQLRWSYLDRDVIRVPGEICKNRQARIVAITPEIETILQRRKRAMIPGCDLIFHNQGRKIGDYRKAWQTSCLAIGLAFLYCRDCRNPDTGEYLGKLDATRHCERCGKKWAKDKAKYIGAIFHDFRRSAAYEMWKSGNSVEDCMNAMAMKTPSIFKRYADLFSDEEKRERQMQVQQKRATWRASQAKAQQTASAPVLSMVQ
jgi:integrase